MTEHTPGPWTIEGPVALRGGDYWSVIVPGIEEPIDLYAEDNGEANARLIAAAPDMLAALDLAREIIQGHFQDDCEDCMAAYGAVCAAIAKATGDQSSASAQ